MSKDDKVFVNRAVEATIRIGFIVLLVGWCFRIISPFLGPVVWGAVIAIAAYPLYARLLAALGGHSGRAAAVFVIVGLTALIVPTVMLSGTLIDTGQSVAAILHDGDLEIPAPPESVAGWPFIGQRVFDYWSLAATNLEAALGKAAPQLQAFGGWLLATVAGAGLVVLQFVISIIIAAALLANESSALRAARSIAARVADDRGDAIIAVAGSTIRSVATGVLGVAVIQSIAGGLGMLAAGVPGAGLWALFILIVAVVQLPPMVVLGPVAVYVFTASSTPVAVLFLAWAIVISISDTFLKPLLMGRGGEVPVLVIFLGAIGGMMSGGILGLFVGAVVLTLGYKLLLAWLGTDAATTTA